MRWTAEGTKEATSIFEAAAFHRAVKPVCRCGHSASFNPHGLWWLFQKRGWDDRFSSARQRFYCRVCVAKMGRRIRPARLELVRESSADFRYAMPNEGEWKRAINRFR